MGSRFDDGPKFKGGLNIEEKTDDISTATAPSAAECATAFGAAATHDVPEGYHKFLGTIDDNAAGNNSVLVFTDGTAFFYVSLTKAS